MDVGKRISESLVCLLGGSAAGKGVVKEQMVKQATSDGYVVFTLESGDMFRNKKKLGKQVVVGWKYLPDGSKEPIKFVIPENDDTTDAATADNGEMVETLYGVAPQMRAFFDVANLDLIKGENTKIILDGLTRLSEYEHKGVVIESQVRQISGVWSESIKGMGISLEKTDVEKSMDEGTFVLVDAPRRNSEKQMLSRIEQQLATVPRENVLAMGLVGIINGVVNGTIEGVVFHEALRGLQDLGYSVGVRKDDAIAASRESRLNAWLYLDNNGGLNPGRVAQTAIGLGFGFDHENERFYSTRRNRIVIPNDELSLKQLGDISMKVIAETYNPMFRR